MSAARLRASLEALTQWQVPGGYVGSPGEAFEPVRAVAVLRVDEVMRALDEAHEQAPSALAFAASTPTIAWGQG